MAGRFPGAAGSVDELWQRGPGRPWRRITRFEARRAGRRRDRGRRPAPATCRPAACWTASSSSTPACFGYHPREAELIDPQQRLFLECAWTALERRRLRPGRLRRAIGVFAGTAISTLPAAATWPARLPRRAATCCRSSSATTRTTSPTRVAYRLGPDAGRRSPCRPPARPRSSRCTMAVQSLLRGECDLALAGGVAVELPQRAGYLYERGRHPLARRALPRLRRARRRAPWPAAASGMVVLSAWPRTPSATATRSHAVIRGSAVNNDGAAKVGYTAPERGRPGRGDPRRRCGAAGVDAGAASATSRRTAPAPRSATRSRSPR